jgi:hypothetical protein
MGFHSFFLDLLVRIESQLFAVAIGGIWKSEYSYRVQIDLGIIELGLNTVSALTGFKPNSIHRRT